MAKKSSKTEFREYLFQLLVSIGGDSKSDMFYEEQVDSIIRTAGRVFHEKEETVADKSDINAVYSSYPTRCIVTFRNLGKSASDKEKIARLLKDKTKDELILTIQRYVEDCKRDKVYMKNFGTFLNNLPEYDLTEDCDIENVAVKVNMNNGGYRDFKLIEELQ